MSLVSRIKYNVLFTLLKNDASIPTCEADNRSFICERGSVYSHCQINFVALPYHVVQLPLWCLSEKHLQHFPNQQVLL